jgi:pimeloyl-ACP methyl ester carboxylesterase
MLHGAMTTIDTAFGKQIPEFSKQHHVIAIEQMGHGHSPDADRPYTFEHMADDTASVLEQLHVRDADVVGWSYGGVIALMLARKHPELVRRVAVSGANFRPEGTAPSTLEWLRNTSPEDMAKQLPAEWRNAYAAESPDGIAHWPVVIGKLKALFLAPGPMAISDLSAIRAPALVIAGDNDGVRLDETLAIFHALKKAQLFIVPGSGHPTFQTAPELMNVAILRFLDQP